MQRSGSSRSIRVKPATPDNEVDNLDPGKVSPTYSTFELNVADTISTNISRSASPELLINDEKLDLDYGSTPLPASAVSDVPPPPPVYLVSLI